MANQRAKVTKQFVQNKSLEMIDKDTFFVFL